MSNSDSNNTNGKEQSSRETLDSLRERLSGIGIGVRGGPGISRMFEEMMRGHGHSPDCPHRELSPEREAQLHNDAEVLTKVVDIGNAQIERLDSAINVELARIYREQFTDQLPLAVSLFFTPTGHFIAGFKIECTVAGFKADDSVIHTAVATKFWEVDLDRTIRTTDLAQRVIGMQQLLRYLKVIHAFPSAALICFADDNETESAE